MRILRNTANPEFGQFLWPSLLIGWVSESMPKRLSNAREAIGSNVPERKITHNDVLLGRGAASDRFEGNIQFRTLIRAHKSEYCSSMNPNEKAFIAHQVVQTIQANQGRFLRKIKFPGEWAQDIDSPMWETVSDSVAIEKVKQAFRDMDHRASVTRRAPGNNLPDPFSTAPLVAPTLTPSTTGHGTLLQRGRPPSIGLGASCQTRFDHGNDPVRDFFHTNHQSSHVPSESAMQPSVVFESLPLINIVSGGQPTAASENHALGFLAHLATYQLSGNANDTPCTTAILPETIAHAPITLQTAQRDDIGTERPIPSVTQATPYSLHGQPVLRLSSTNETNKVHPTAAASLHDRTYSLAPSIQGQASPALPAASLHNRLDPSSLAPDLLQQFSQQVAYPDLSRALVAPPQINQFTAAPFSLPATAVSGAPSSAMSVDWNQLLGGRSIAPPLAYQNLLYSLVSPPPNPFATAFTSSLRTAATSIPTTMIPLDTSALSNAAWDHVPGHYLSHLPLVQNGSAGPFNSFDWYLIRAALARAEAARNGSALLQIRSVLQTAMTLPLHRADLTREDIMAMAETLQ
jgi:hypothetical protein